MRVTRAAQRAQQDVEEEHVEAFEANERALKDIEPNTTPAAPIEEPLSARTPAKTPAKKGRGKGKKGVKGKKAKTEEEELAQVVDEADRAAVSAEYEAAGQEPTQQHADEVAQDPNESEQTKMPQTPAVRLTRRQLAKLEEEALSKSQRAPRPSAAEEAVVEDVSEEAREQPEAASEVRDDVTTGEDVTPAAHEETVEVEPQTARKPTRRTRHHHTNGKEEHSEIPVAEATETVVKKPDASVEAANAAVDVEKLAMAEQIEKIKPEPASKPIRLTRRQQAKLEEEQKQAQAEQETQQSEPTEEESLEGRVAEAQVGFDATKREENVMAEEPAHEETDKTDDVTPVATIESSNAHEEALTARPRGEPAQVEMESVEREAIIEAQPVESKIQETAAVEDAPHEVAAERPATPTEAEFEADFDMHVDDAVADEVAPSVKVTSEAEPKMLHAEKPLDGGVTTPTKTQGSTRRTSRSPSKSPMRLEESISAIDRLEEDLESIGKAIPDLDHSDDETPIQKSQTPKASASSAARGKTPNKTPAKASGRASARTPAKVEAKTSIQTAKKPTAARAPHAARASIAPKPLVPIKAALPTRISRVPSAAPKSVKPTTTSLARASSVRAVPSKGVKKPSTETADYLASKRRPISLSFPTPPPPPKGRAPTKPAFQLSSDNVAAKLKVQKEERMKREAEGAAAPRQRPISMPPPPKSTKPPTVPSFQLPGEATAAKLKAQKEERLKRMEGVGGAEKPALRPISMPPPPKSTKQLTKPSFQLPGEATAARLKAQKEERLRRMEEAEAAKKVAAAALVRKPIAHRPRESLLARDAPGVSIPPPLQTGAPQRSTSIASKRSSIGGASASRSVSTSSANRNSVLLAEGGKSTVTPVDAAALKVKGKQVFNRDRMEKEAMDRERREKEEAAKRARAEAAERGRIASREWAERQRKKLMGQ
ncbi:hypothetical protein E8E12_005918 [Didymella heteroderae]|uniref:Carboxylesterase family protein n=1 Tax=Didymella heteroderae TaxID=1769908 RepID=A0A9P4WJJ3_9PLEO|nr:hypothetical protein E8E12_005918 [Didymella heteroderae]